MVYGFNKLISLLLNCNPNTIEILGLDEDQYLIKTALGQELLDNRDLFLSKRAAASFGHYADAQLRRLQNAIARDTLSQPSREQHILKSVQHTLDDFKRRYQEDEENQARIFIDDAVTEGLEKEIFLQASFRHYPLRRYNDLMNSLNSGNSQTVLVKVARPCPTEHMCKRQALFYIVGEWPFSPDPNRRTMNNIIIHIISSIYYSVQTTWINKRTFRIYKVEDNKQNRSIIVEKVAWNRGAKRYEH